MNVFIKVKLDAWKRCVACALLASGVVGAGGARAGIVDDMLVAGVPHTEWYDFDFMDIRVNLVRNPGLWSLPVRDRGITTTVWEGADAAGQGATIPPYSTMNYWYQREVECVSPDFRGCSHRTSLYPNLDHNGTFSSLLAIAADVPLAALGLRVSAYAAKTVSNAWIYRYTFSNVTDVPKTFEFELSEFDNHEGLHDEFNFHDANGVHDYDQRPFSAAVDTHNYGWSSITLDPGASMVMGFSDVHGPAMETWGVRTADGIHSETLLKLPVPTVPEPSTLALMLASFVSLIALGRRPSAFNA